MPTAQRRLGTLLNVDQVDRQRFMPNNGGCSGEVPWQQRRNDLSQLVSRFSCPLLIRWLHHNLWRQQVLRFGLSLVRQQETQARCSEKCSAFWASVFALK